MLPDAGGGLTFLVLFVVAAVVSGSCVIFTIALELNAAPARTSVEKALTKTVAALAANKTRSLRGRHAFLILCSTEAALGIAAPPALPLVDRKKARSKANP